MSSMEMEQPPVRVRRSFSDEFERDAVSLVLDEGRQIVDAASSLGIGDGTLGNPKIPGHLSDRFLGLTNNPDSALTKLWIILSALLSWMWANGCSFVG